MIYRLARPEDVPAILEIYRPYVEKTTVSFEYETPSLEAFAQRFARITADYPWYVAEEGGEIAGYAYASRAFERRAYCWDADLSVYIAAQWHGRGIGRRFYELLENDLKRMGYVTAYAIVTGENAASLAFHKKMGYTLVAELPHVGFKMGKWLSVRWLEKRLRDPSDPGDAPLRFAELKNLAEGCGNND